MPTLNIAIIGCGAITQRFYTPALESLARTHHMRVSAIADVNLQAATCVQKSFPQAQVFNKLDDLSPDLAQLAIVASPAAFHASQSIFLLQKGFHVLCEKPMALSYKDARQMVDASLSVNRLLAIGLFRRFFPVVDTIAYIIKEKPFGRVKSFDYQEGGPFSWPITSPDIFQKNKKGSGILADLGVHGLDLLFHWFGYPMGHICEKDTIDGVDTHIDMHISFDNAIEGRFALSWHTPLRNTFIMECEHALIEWPLSQTSQLSIRPHRIPVFWECNLLKDVSTHPIERITCSAGDFSSCFMAGLVNVRDAILNNDQLKVNALEAAKSICFIEKAFEKTAL